MQVSLSHIPRPTRTILQSWIFPTLTKETATDENYRVGTVRHLSHRRGNWLCALSPAVSNLKSGRGEEHKWLSIMLRSVTDALKELTDFSPKNLKDFFWTKTSDYDKDLARSYFIATQNTHGRYEEVYRALRKLDEDTRSLWIFDRGYLGERINNPQITVDDIYNLLREQLTGLKKYIQALSTKVDMGHKLDTQDIEALATKVTAFHACTDEIISHLLSEEQS